jgi:DNA-binding XRE family transcriptional regulator
MDLRSYRNELKTPFAHIARSVGVSAASITLIAKGRRRPSQKLADAIERVTGGHIRAVDLRHDTNLPAASRVAPPVPPGAGPSGEAASRNPESDSAGEFRIAPKCAPAGTVAGTAADHAADHAPDEGADRGDSVTREPGIAVGSNDSFPPSCRRLP